MFTLLLSQRDTYFEFFGASENVLSAVFLGVCPYSGRIHCGMYSEDKMVPSRAYSYVHA
jgi:hypothetical protein